MHAVNLVRLVDVDLTKESDSLVPSSVPSWAYADWISEKLEAVYMHSRTTLEYTLVTHKWMTFSARKAAKQQALFHCHYKCDSSELTIQLCGHPINGVTVFRSAKKEGL